MVVYSGGLIIGGLFANEIRGTYFRAVCVGESGGGGLLELVCGTDSFVFVGLCLH